MVHVETSARTWAYLDSCSAVRTGLGDGEVEGEGRGMGVLRGPSLGAVHSTSSSSFAPPVAAPPPIVVFVALLAGVSWVDVTDLKDPSREAGESGRESAAAAGVPLVVGLTAAIFLIQDAVDGQDLGEERRDVRVEEA